MIWEVLLVYQRKSVFAKSPLNVSEMSVYPGFILEVVHRCETVQTGHTTVMKAKQNIFVILSGILQILSNQQKVWFETPWQ